MLKVTNKQYDDLVDAMEKLHRVGLVLMQGERMVFTRNSICLAQEVQVEDPCSCKP
jgi:hypothetical protein